MILDTNQVVIELEYRGILPLENAGGTRINCLRGRIWITEHRSMIDVVLEAGESYQTSRPGVAVLQALRESIVALYAPALSLARAGPAAQMLRLWKLWAARGAPAAHAFPATNVRFR